MEGKPRKSKLEEGGVCFLVEQKKPKYLDFSIHLKVPC